MAYPSLMSASLHVSDLINFMVACNSCNLLTWLCMHCYKDIVV